MLQFKDPAYAEGVVTDPGFSKVAQDIYMVQFWKEDFCNQLIEKIDKAYIDNSGSIDYSDNIPANDLPIDYVSDTLFDDYCLHSKGLILPIVNDAFFGDYNKKVADNNDRTENLSITAESWFNGWQRPIFGKYEKGIHESIGMHFDSGIISFSIKLNNNYDGGLLNFPRQGYNNIDAPVGSMLFWPSNPSHIHESTPIESGAKYFLANWSLAYEYTGTLWRSYKQI